MAGLPGLAWGLLNRGIYNRKRKPIMSRLSVPALLLGLGMTSSAMAMLPPGAVSVNGTLTADNHYGLYVGQADGGGLRFIGRNEKGAAGAPGTYNWSEAETWNFLVTPGEHLYVMAWDDGGPQGWIGNFGWSGGGVASNLPAWQAAIAPGGNPGSSGDLPATATLSGYIAAASWQAPGASAANGSSPWGSINGVGSAQWIWHDTLADGSLSDANFAMFRTASPLVAAVPEPSTYAMLGLGALMVLFATRRIGRDQRERLIG